MLCIILGYKCKEMRDNNDILFEDLMKKKKWVSCPQCKQCVELAAGCNIITCKYVYLYVDYISHTNSLYRL